MRNGTKMLLLTAIVMAGAACLLFRGAEGTNAAPALAATDSGAPAAMVLFPVSNQPNSGAMGMKPVVFNHKLHESTVQECESCHHTGDPVACSSCHTVEGKKDGNFVTLDRAMHADNIIQRKGGRTPQSCVSCHEKRYSQRNECAGCHAVVTPRRDAAWCAVCHTGVECMSAIQTAEALAGRMDPDVNEELARKALAAKKPVQYADPGAMALKVRIDALVDKYEANVFNHARHVNSIMNRISGDKLAQAFHSAPETLCQTCHHHSPASATPPKCVSCHTPGIDKQNPGRPPLKAAYHLQCMGCHDGMNVRRPAKTDCTGCHKERVAQKGGSK